MTFAPPRRGRAPLASLIVGLVALAAALWVGFRPIGPVPPLGGFLSPVRGVWALARTAELPTDASARIATLDANVEVRYDERGVPHIFAASELDALRALGYVVARDRLFQLELQARASAGRLTELVGEAALDADREMRRIGLPWGARAKLAAISPGSDAMRALEAYADGVNTYIASLRDADLPLEYRLLNARPQQWRPEHTMLLLMRMAHTLAWSDFELDRAMIEARIGATATDALFPRDAWLQEPIQPNGQSSPRLERSRLPLPAPQPDSAAALRARTLAALSPRRDADTQGAVGSNSWAVSPSRSRSGHALLANDPHLNLSLPSTWYEAHLVVPDSLNVYGVTLPGATGIILGLNRDIAWGSTNVGADVADYYVERVDDARAPTQYEVDGEWRPLEREVSEYRGRSGELLATDTLYRTHRGPMEHVGTSWISRRWLVLDPSDELDAFRTVQRARSVTEFLNAMERYQSPAQNLIVADRQGNIGIRSNGRYPVRPGDGRGDRLFDGTSRSSDWTGWIEPAEAPESVNPPQGYLASANQQPVDPRNDRRYFGNEWPSPWRAAHINALLRANDRVGPDDMRAYQTDPGNARADAFVPLLLAAAASLPDDTTLARAARLLSEWDRRFTPENARAVLFEAAMSELNRLTWDELSADSVPTSETPQRLIASPPEDVLLALTADPQSVWWDRPVTPARETRDQILGAALAGALRRVESDRGPVERGGWRWSGIRFANIWHPLRIPALSALRIPVQGGRENLNPSSGTGTHGASWRLVAELGPTVRGWATYPGGQSANALSSRYRDRIDGWQRGALDTLRLPASPADLGPAQSRAVLVLSPGRGQ